MSQLAPGVEYTPPAISQSKERVRRAGTVSVIGVSWPLHMTERSIGESMWRQWCGGCVHSCGEQPAVYMAEDRF